MGVPYSQSELALSDNVIAESTVVQYMERLSTPPFQNWRALLKTRAAKVTAVELMGHGNERNATLLERLPNAGEVEPRSVPLLIGLAGTHSRGKNSRTKVQNVVADSTAPSGGSKASWS